MEKNKSGECSSSYSSSSSDDDSYERRGDGYGSSGADVSGGCSTSTATSSQLTFTRFEAPVNVGDTENEIRTASSEGCSCSSPSPLALLGGRDYVVWEDDTHKLHSHISEMDMMKEKFSKLLLGEDMSGCGKGVCSALALSNAITNLSASVFGELWRLEPLSSAKKDMWKREMDWLLCVSDSIVELIPTWQETPEGGSQEIMVSRPRSDLYINLPALRKLDAMLQEILDNFSEKEFWYVDREIYYGGGNVVGYAPICRFSQLQGEKWWLPSVKVPANGLSEQTRKYLQNHKECCSQILKASMAINSHVLSEMEVPKSYMDSLPKTGKASLGDIVYRYITAEQFSPEHLLDCLDLSSEHHILEIANRIESAVHIWKQKSANKRQHNVKLSRTYSSSWGRVKTLLGDVEKDMLTERAETLLMTLKLRFPGLSQTVLDMNKIQHNKDVGQSILESYSRVLESLAYNIIARIDDILQADDMAKHFTPNRPSVADCYNRVRSTSDYSSSLLVPMPSSSAFPTPFATPIFSPLRKDI